METILLFPLVYYFIGVCYSYEVYKDLEWLDVLSSPKQMLIASFYYPVFWVIFWAQPRVKRLRNWITVKKSHYYNRIIR